ncbi:MAG: preprotein translocase subunit YajC [Propionibacterium sp.]|nr:preprotein translocase subunit YajC [Propionibacterium sp.]
MPEGITSTLLLVAVMGLLFYLLLIRPQQRRVKEQTKMMDALQPGTTVMLSSGIIANVVEIGDTQVLVEIAPGLEMSVLKQVIINTSATDEFAADDDVLPADDEVFTDDAATDVPVADEALADPDRTDSDALTGAEPTTDPEVDRPGRNQE